MALYAVIGAHVFCQLYYSACMWHAVSAPRIRALWLAVIWLIPIFGIGLGGARFSRGGRSQAE